MRKEGLSGDSSVTGLRSSSTFILIGVQIDGFSSTAKELVELAILRNQKAQESDLPGDEA